MMREHGGKTYRPWKPERYQQGAYSPAAKLSEGDLVFFLLETVPRLDLSRFYASYEKETRGAPPYDPAMTNHKGWDYCGNAQASVDDAYQIILAGDVTDAPNDSVMGGRRRRPKPTRRGCARNEMAFLKGPVPLTGGLMWPRRCLWPVWIKMTCLPQI